MKKIFFATSALTLTLMTGSAFAADKGMDKGMDKTSEMSRQIQMLQDQLRSMQQQLDAVKAGEAAQTQAIAAEAAAREAALKAAKEANLDAGGHNVFENGQVKLIPPANPKVTESGSHSFTMQSADGKWSISPTGRVHFDMGAYINQSPEGTTGIGTAAGGKLSGGVNIRRARLGVTGKAMGDFTYTLILEAGGTNDGVVAGTSAQLVNTASIGYTGIKNTILEAGYFAQFFTLDESTSSNNIMFMERATPVTVASGVNTGDPRFGAGFRTWESNWWFGAYVTASSPGATKSLTNRGFGAYQRATYQIVQDDLESVHVGVGMAELFQVPTGTPQTTTAPTITLSDRPELRIDGGQFLSTGALGTFANPVTGVQIYNAEAAAAYGNFFAQTEYFHYVVNRRGKTDAAFDGGYLEASYTVGGRRTYSANCGCYGGINPVTPFSPTKGDLGAFEFAARVSYINLTDQYHSGLASAAQPNFVNGGQQTSYTAGLNWYWNSNMLWKLNYIHTNYDKSTNPTAAKAGITADAIAARFQFMF